jgi:hypothetical protein
MDDQINFWIGSEHKTNIPCKVLQHSILKTTKYPEQIKFFVKPGISWKTTAGRKLGEGTGFSLQRWYIPEQFDYKGFCIYLDADMIVFYDIVELWNYHFELVRQSRSIACTYQRDKWFDKAPATSAMLIDNYEAAHWQLCNQEEIEKFLTDDKDRKRYIALMHADENLFNSKPLEVDPAWNRFNKFIPGTKLLHYTVEPDQPWYNPGHPFKGLWRDYLVSALEDGYITGAEVETELKRYQKPSGCCRGEGLNPYWRKFLHHASA